MYVSLNLIDPSSFNGIPASKNVTLTFISFIYFASEISCKNGIGDVSPNHIFPRLLVTCHIFYSSLIILIFFRGLFFFIRLEEVEEFETQYQLEKDHAMKQILE